ncbi:hypothetical protein [Castellaniella sp.]|uniref:hypothetical protein n=1 Tax=Castellaniella sp. TaxID=1955812 RepID=UPI002AFE39BA|nr:hypothetical protein [Castellaniella sp.]
MKMQFDVQTALKSSRAATIPAKLITRTVTLGGVTSITTRKGHDITRIIDDMSAWSDDVCDMPDMADGMIQIAQ